MAKIKIKSLVNSIIYHILLLAFSYFFNKLFQTILFLATFNLFQNCFKYRFHFDYVTESNIKAMKLCKITTIIIELIYLLMSKNLNLSLFLNFVIIIIISILNCFLGLYITLNNNKNIYKDKDLLLQVCKQANLTSLATKRIILKYINNKTYTEIALEEKMEIETIKKSINRSRKKIDKCLPFVH